MLFVVNSEVITYNAALNRPAYQSSVYNDTYGGPYPAHYANDGSRHTTYSTGTKCAVTKQELNPWWAVDLEHPLAIYGVDLTTSRYTCTKTNITGLDLLDLLPCDAL